MFRACDFALTFYFHGFDLGLTGDIFRNAHDDDCLTAAYHLFSVLGVWGLYGVQALDKNAFSLAGAALVSVGNFSRCYRYR